MRHAALAPLRSLALGLWLGLAALPAAAAPRAYALVEGSEVAFTWYWGADPYRGAMGIAGADIRIDWDAPSASTVVVDVDVTRAVAGFAFADEAMRGPRVLDAASFPTIRFVSRTVTQTGPSTARVEGEFTIRGVTRPGAMDAAFSRAPGADLSRVAVDLTGTIQRSEFGATGWSDLVGDRIDLDIRAELAAR